MRKLFTLIAIIFVSCGNANAEVEKCTIATKYVCTPEECVKKDSSIWILLDFTKEVKKIYDLVNEYDSQLFKMDKWFLIRNFIHLRRRKRDSIFLLISLITSIFKIQ